MSTAFAALELALGAATTGAFSNATAVLPSANTVDGVFTRAPAIGPGGIGMQAREVSFVCRTEALAEPVVKGTLLVIDAVTWKVQLRTDVLETGDTELDLEQP